MHYWTLPEQARKLHGNAIELMETNGIVLTPDNYELCFHYESGLNEQLQLEFGAILRAGQASEGEVTAHLHEKFFRLAQGASVVDVMSGLENEIEKIASVLEGTDGSTSAYGRSLSLASLQATRVETSSQLRALLDTVAAATLLMSENVKLLEARLEQSTSEVSALRSKMEIVRKESLTDALTGLANRRSFDEALATVLAAGQADGTSACVLMCDIDLFKKFNDTWGHATGDQVLRLVAQCVKSNIKARDTAARFGGEEFVVILPKTSMADAMIVAEQIRRTVQSRKIVKKHTGDSLGSITLSIGVSEYKPGETAIDCLARADACLYAAKSAGRNRVNAVLPDTTEMTSAHGEVKAGGTSLQLPGDSVMELAFNDNQTEICVDPGAAPIDERLQRLLEWWRIAGKAGAFRWQDQLLNDLAYLREAIHLYAVIDDGAEFRVRWVGDSLIKRLGQDPTGLSITSMPSQSAQLAPSLMRTFEVARLTTLMNSPIRTFSKTSHNLNGSPFRGESLYLPFANGKSPVSHILAATVLTAAGAESAPSGE